MAGAGFAALSAGVLNVADDLVAVLALGAGPSQVGLLNAASSAGFVFLSVPVGWWLDVVDRRRTLMWTQALATLALISVPVTWMLGALTFPQLLVTSFVVGVAGMVWGLGISTLLPGVVGRDRAGGAFSRLQGIETTAGLVAPGLTGILIAVLAAPMALFFAACFELLAGISLWWGGRRRGGEWRGHAESAASGAETGGAQSEPRQRPGFWAGVAEGFRFAMGQKVILLLTFVSTAGNACLALVSAVEAVYFVRGLGYEPPLIGAIGVATAASALLGSLVGGRLLDRYRGVTIAAVGTLVAMFGIVALPVASLVDGFAWSLPWILVFILVWNGAIVVSNAGTYGLVAAATPDHLMGRVQAFRRFISRSAIPLFGIVGGALGSGVGVVATLWIGVGLAGVSAVLAVAVWFVVRWD